MATILIVDDRPANREVLTSLLGYSGHQLLEASDGAEALAHVRAAHPDLVIADILMPTMDGYEFVRQLRGDPTIAQTPVIFCSAHYLEREARSLAEHCGIAHILKKPIDPELVLRTVDAALSAAAPLPAPSPAEDFDREHLRIITNKLSQKAEELRAVNGRLTALIELGQDLASERDPMRILQGLCRRARDIVGARFAAVGVLADTGNELRFFLTSGIDHETASRIGSPILGQGVLATLSMERRAVRLAGPTDDLVRVEMPAHYPATSSLLAVAIVSLKRHYGWLCLTNKLGGGEFSEEDERLAVMLAGQVGRIYENGRLYEDLQGYSKQLEAEVAERRRAAERLLLQSTALMAAANAIVITDAAGEIVWVNAAFCRLTGYDGDEVVGRNPRLLKSGVQDDAFYDLLWRTIRSGHVWSGEVTNRRKDGSLYIGEMTITPVLQGGEVTHFIAIQQDITERKQAAEQLRRHALRLENLRAIDRAILAQDSPEGVARATLARIRQLVPCDVATVVLFDLTARTARRLATNTMPGDPVDVATFSLDEFSAPNAFLEHPSRYVEDIATLPARPPILDRLLRAGMHSVITESLLVRGELLGSFNLSAKQRAAFAPEHRDISREVAAQLAITIQQARLREQLQQHAAELEHRVAERTAQLETANRELEAFSYSVSHDLRAPLRAIGGFARMLVEDCAGQLDDTGRQYLDRVQMSAQHMGRLIDDLLNLSRLSRRELRYQVVDLSAMAHAVAAELRQTQPQRRVTFVIADGVTAHGDPTLLRAVLDNLLGNAWKYTGKHASARIEFGTMSLAELRAHIADAADPVGMGDGGPESDQLYFVRDDGAGFDSQYTDKLFGAFQRLHTTEEFEGTGIGLASVQRIIHRHHGRVWAHGAVEQGATIYFTLPPRAGD